VIVGEDQRIEFANRQVESCLGYTPEEIVGTLFHRLLTPESLEKAIRIHERGRTGEPTPSVSELQVITRGGAIKTVEAAASKVKSRDGELETLITFRDITERKKVEQALRGSEERYRRLVEDMSALICRFLPDGTLTFVNQAYCDYFNRRREELVGENFFQFIPEEDRKTVKDHYSFLSKERPAVTYEHQVVAPDGTIRYQRWTDRVILDDEDRPVEYQSIGQDVTEQRRLREKLKESEERYRTIVENAQDGIIMTEGPERRIIFANQSIARLLGYPAPEELSGKRYMELVHPDEREESLQNIKTDQLTGEGNKYLRRLVRRDGTAIHTLITTSPLSPDDKASSPAILIITDITGNTEVRETLTQAIKKMETLEKEVADLKWQLAPETEKEREIGIAELLELPDHLRETLIALSVLEEATAREVAEKTGRVRNMESHYLNQLHRMRLIGKMRRGRRVYFRTRYVQGRTVRQVLEQLYEEME